MIPRIIILEGPDCSGKSTLAKELLSRYKNSVYLHMKHKFKKLMFHYNTAVFMQAERHLAEGKTVIIDRCWISENIYGGVLRNGGGWPLIGRYMERLFQKHSYVGVICKPWDDLYEQVWRHKDQKDKDHPYKDNDYALIVSHYDNLANMTKTGLSPSTYISTILSKERGIEEWPWINYDHRNDLVEDIVDTIEFILERRDPSIYDQFNFDPNVTGNISSPKVLIVGERTNYLSKQKLRKDIGYPFHEYASSSLLINSALQELGVLESDICFMNACHLGKSQEYSLRTILDEKNVPVIALGGTARHLVEKATQKYNSGTKEIYYTYHPSFAKRFKHEPAFKQDLAHAFKKAGVL